MPTPDAIVRRARARAKARKSSTPPKNPSPRPVADPPNEEVWVTAAGERIKIGAMAEDHCRNALRMLLRQRRQGKLLTRREAFEFVAKALEAAAKGTVATYLRHHVEVTEDTQCGF